MGKTKAVDGIIDTIKEATKEKSQGYDTTATVQRVEGTTAWVHIPGGVEETPARLTINAKEGDTVQVRVSNGSAFLVGNGSAPPTDDGTAIQAINYAKVASNAAESAVNDAGIAREAAASASAAATSAVQDAATAKTSAENASEYASRALGNLSTVQSVAETLTWIAEHGQMTLTTDTELDPTHVYFVQDNDGDYVVAGTHYAIVPEPKAEDLSSYYVLSIDESLNNYIATHLALTDDGLYVLKDGDGWKVLIKSNGVYIMDNNDNMVAQYRDKVILGNEASRRVEIENSGTSFYDSQGLVVGQISTSSMVNRQEINMAIDASAANQMIENHDETELRGAPSSDVKVKFNMLADSADPDYVTPAEITSWEHDFSDFGDYTEKGITVGYSQKGTGESVISLSANQADKTFLIADEGINSKQWFFNLSNYVESIPDSTFDISVDYYNDRAPAELMTASGSVGISASGVVLDQNIYVGRSTVSIKPFAYRVSCTSSSFTIKNVNITWPIKVPSVYILPVSLSYTTEIYAPVIMFGTYNNMDDAYSIGENSFCVGYKNNAHGNGSAAFGEGNTSMRSGSIVAGKYAVIDQDYQYLLQIGNGSENSASNAFCVDVDGEIKMALNTSAASGTVDGALYTAINTLGWTSDVIATD